MTLADDFRFACPYCSQHLACSAGYSGHHVQCPNCGGTLVIPPTRPPAPAAPSAVPAPPALPLKQSLWQTFVAGPKMRESIKLLALPATMMVMMVGPPVIGFYAQQHLHLWLASTVNNVAFVAAWVSPLAASLLLALRVEAVWARIPLFIVFCPVCYFMEFFIVVVVAFVSTPPVRYAH